MPIPLRQQVSISPRSTRCSYSSTEEFIANFNTDSAHIVQELVAQGYIVVAPDYRGSTGYGEQFYKFIDYGRSRGRRCLCCPQLHDRE
ncbi:MAG: prolyl oligopeptidase family serine peptidase [Bacillota bacterium]